MKPRKPSSQEPQRELFRVELIHLIDLEHALAKLAGVVDWSKFDAAFEPLFDEQTGRPAISTRLMVGLHYLRQLHGLSDEKRW
jgi:transposase, IS5 family